MTRPPRPDIAATPAPGCPACESKDWRRHTDAERRAYHPFAGHGFNGTTWSHPDLDPKRGAA